MERVIALADCNSFYASVEILYNRQLQDKPVAVCGSVDKRHGIVLAANPIAKKYGVKTADAAWQALSKCPQLVLVEPHMDRYVEFSKAAREIYSDFSPLVSPFGLDECYIDLTGTGHLFGNGLQTADKIRTRIKNELGISISVGVSFNKSMAKLASELRKPDYSNVISRDNFKEIVWPRHVSDLYYCGSATTKKLSDFGINTIGQLAVAPEVFIRRRLGAHGIMLMQYANGIDNDPVTVTGHKSVPKSIGNSTTTPRDLETPEDIRVTTMLLSESVAERLRDQSFKCKTIQVWIRYSTLAGFERQVKLAFPSCTAQRIGDTATELILKNWSGDPLRSLGVRACDLINNEITQLSLLPDVKADQKQEDLEVAMQAIRKRYGHFSIQRGIMLADKRLSELDTQVEASAQSIAFYRG